MAVVKKLRRKLTINEQGIFLDRAARVVEKEISRKELRSLCSQFGIKFSQRDLKYTLARRICNHYLDLGQIEPIKDIVIKGRGHWEEKIRVNDRHKPWLYESMLHLSDLTLKMIKRLEE